MKDRILRQALSGLVGPERLQHFHHDDSPFGHSADLVWDGNHLGCLRFPGPSGTG